MLAFASQPVFLFGAIFNGWIAGGIYAFFAALSLYIGKGLLDLREEARLLAIGWFGNNAAFGHVVLALVAGQGTVTFSGGTGKFTHFNGSVVVTRVGAPALKTWRWDGTYSFDPRD